MTSSTPQHGSAEDRDVHWLNVTSTKNWILPCSHFELVVIPKILKIFGFPARIPRFPFLFHNELNLIAAPLPPKL